jgi:hypothetical protein
MTKENDKDPTSSKMPETKAGNAEDILKRGLAVDVALLRGVYSNLAMVSHTPTEFVLDFMFEAPGGTMLTSRIITNPSLVKRLAHALNLNIKKYEERFGVINEELGKSPL